MSDKKAVILFVDDEYYVLQTLKAVLRRDFEGYQLLFAQNGQEALNLLSNLSREETAHLLVFSDWLMPGMKGDELLLEIAEKYPSSINFLLSGMINREPPPDIFRRARIRQIVEKPWDNKELITLIKRALS
jgi:response regulator RpfG family c-di-GMP phosphodiesterase